MAQNEKRELRRTVIARRDAIPRELRADKSAIICRELWSLVSGMPSEAARPQTVAVYSAMGSEVDLDLFIRSAYESGMRVAFPAVLPAPHRGQRMKMRAVSKADYESGAAPFVTDPVPAFEATPEQDERFPVVKPRELDMIIVPMVAYDDANRRLGYGGGCYDRYLPALCEHCIIAGPAFAEQHVPRVPTDEHDRTLPRIITA